MYELRNVVISSASEGSPRCSQIFISDCRYSYKILLFIPDTQFILNEAVGNGLFQLVIKNQTLIKYILSLNLLFQIVWMQPCRLLNSLKIRNSICPFLFDRADKNIR